MQLKVSFVLLSQVITFSARLAFSSFILSMSFTAALLVFIDHPHHV